LTGRIRVGWRGERRGLGRAALLFVITLGGYWIVWVTRVYAGLRSRSPAPTRLGPLAVAVLGLLPLVNVAFEAFLALDLPRAVRRARASEPGGPSVETEPLTVLLLAAPFGAIAVAIAIGLSPLLIGYLAWPFELPAMLTVQRVLNGQTRDEIHAERPVQRTPTRLLDGETIASLVLALAIAGALAVALASGGEEEKASKVRPAPQEQFSDIAISPEGLWITRIDKGTLQRLDPRDGHPVGVPITVGRSPYDVASGYGAIWVANYRSDSVSRINPTTGHAAIPIEVGRGPFGITVGLGSVWVTDEVDRRIVRIDPKTNRVLRRIPIGYGPRGVEVGEGAVWAAASESKAVYRFDPSSRRTTRIPVGRFCQDVAVGGGSVWVASPQENQVLRIDPARNHVVGKPIGVGLSPNSIDYGDGFVWVANAGDGSVSRIDPRTAKVVGKPIDVGKKISDLSARGRAVWVLRADGKVRMIRT
jgi:YVTN family beta-propeller protein